MQLMAGGKQLKIPELNLEADPSTSLRSARNASHLTAGMALTKLSDKIGGGPIKGLALNTTMGDSKMMTFRN